MEAGHGLKVYEFPLCADKQNSWLIFRPLGTQEIQFARTEIDRRAVMFIDTPGFDDTDRSDVDILGLITAYLQTRNSGEIRLSGIIYLHNITDTRMQGSSVKKHPNVSEPLRG